jgi:peptidoglycan/LPS O-acetylase OafA/YrhL
MPETLEADPQCIAPMKHLPALDGLRGIAILAVFASHFSGGHNSGNFLIHLWSTVADAGWMGVDLFFCLSGFLITGILYDTRHAEKRKRNFYARRSLRIFPLYYGLLIGLFLLTPVLHLVWRPGHLLYLFYLGNLSPLVTPTLGWPGAYVSLEYLWSLAIEEQFYIVWPFVVWFVMDRRKLLNICFAVMLLVLVIRIAMVLHGADPFVVYSLLWTRADSLLCGAALALFLRGQGNPRLPIKWLLPISASATLLMFVAVGSGLHKAPIVCTIGFSVIAVFSTCLVYCAALGDHWLAWVAKRATLRFFGRYSYGLYVYHGILLLLLQPLARPTQKFLHSELIGGVVYVLGVLSLTLCVALCSYHFFEKPILRQKIRFV